MRSNPFETWIVSVFTMLALTMTLFFLVPGKQTPSIFLLFATICFVTPTISIATRLSDSERGNHPVSSLQEERIGNASLFFAFTNVVAMSCALLGIKFGLHSPFLTTEYCLVVYGLTTTVALGLGYAGRRSKSGRMGLRLAGGFFIILVSTLLIYLFIAAQRH